MVWIILASLLVWGVQGIVSAGSLQTNDLLPFSISTNGSQQSTLLAIDANWRWVHPSSSTTNCFTSTWDPALCPDSTTCTANCVVEGIPQSQWAVPYGLSSPASNAIKLNYVTVGPYGTNIGNRLYLVNAQKSGYQPIYLLGSEIRFTVDVSQLPCGVNGAVYLVAVPTQNAQAPFGIGYGDAQCPNDLKVINNLFNVKPLLGACAPEIDLWEANQWATQFAMHPCSSSSLSACSDAKTCGQGANRNQGQCDMDGSDWNPYRNGFRNFFGPGSNYLVDSSRPFTVATQFWTDANGTLSRIQRYYVQDGKIIQSFNQTEASIATQKQAYGETNAFAAHGGMASLTAAMKKGMVLTLSLWDDATAKMLWLDSTYGIGAGAVRGPCPTSSGDPTATRQSYPNANVIYSNVQITPLNPACPICPCPCEAPTPPAPTPSPTPPAPAPSPSPSPSVCIPMWGQCAGQSGSLGICCAPASCKYQNPYYSQCL